MFALIKLFFRKKTSVARYDDAYLLSNTQEIFPKFEFSLKHIMSFRLVWVMKKTTGSENKQTNK